MTAFTEQVVDSTRWSARTQHDLDAPLANTRAKDQLQWRNASPRIGPKARLAQIGEAEILPRLAQARHNPCLARAPQVWPLTRHPQDVASSTTDSSSVANSEDAVELVRLLLTEEAAGAVRFINTLLLRGATPASLYLGVLTQAARFLGELWEQDRCDFAQVTISTGRLQQLVRTLSPLFQMQGVRRTQIDRVMLVPAPGEQHSLGLVMLAEFFAREGWHVTGGPGTSANDAVQIVRTTWIDVVGFSIGSRARLEGLARSVTSVRRISRNPNLCVMVGGPLFLSEPGLVTRVGADGAATDAATAMRTARELISMRVAAD